MPYFNVPNLIIDVDDFMSACSPREIDEIVNYLKENDHYVVPDEKPDGILSDFMENIQRNVIDRTFIKSLNHLRDKWNDLSIEDEETILRISQKY